MKRLGPEETLLRQVLELARLCGWRTAHFRPGLTRAGNWVTAVQGDGKGWPDLVLVRGGRIVFAELKSEKGETSPEQRAWLDALRAACGEVYIWRPSDWEMILEVLR